MCPKVLGKFIETDQQNMGQQKARCYGKCNECFFYYMNSCIALHGDNYFIKINEEHAKLIFKNRSRFAISKKVTNELIHRFPTVSQMQY